MQKLSKKRKITKISLFSLGILLTGLIVTPVIACGVSKHDIAGKDSIRIFTPNAIEAPANGGRSFDSSYTVASLGISVGPTRVNAADSTTYGQYDFDPNIDGTGKDLLTETPKTVAANTGIASGLTDDGKTVAGNEHFLKTDTASDGVKGFDQYQNAGLTVYSFDLRRGFGYTNLHGLQPTGFMPSDPGGQTTDNTVWNSKQPLEVTKWDFLLGYLRFWLASNPADYPDIPFGETATVAQNGYYGQMLGMEINSTVKINLDNSNPYKMYIVTNHSSPAEGILNKEYYSSPVSAGYLQTLLSKNSAFTAMGFNENLQSFLQKEYSSYVPKSKDDSNMPMPVKKYIAATTVLYGKDFQGDYDAFNILFSGKYYISKYKQYQYAVFKLNPYYNQNPITPNGRYHVLVENGKYVGGDSKTFGTINEILSNQSSAIDPTEKAYQLWKDNQIDVLNYKMVNSNSNNDIINNYNDYIVPVGTTPTSQTNNIAFNMNIWNENGQLKGADENGNPTKDSVISKNYEKFTKQFFSPAAIDLRYNLMRAVNYAGVATTVNKISTQSINLSTSPINWGASFDADGKTYPGVKPGNKLDLPQYQDINQLSMAGGLPVAQMQENPTDGFTSQQYISNEKLNWTWGDMQKSVTNDLKALGLYDTGLHMKYLTLVQYSKEQQAVFNSYYSKAWKAVSGGKVSLNLVPFTAEVQEQVYTEKNAEIGSNFWSPDFSNGYGSWYRPFTSHNNFVGPDTIYGLAKQQLLTAAPKTKTVGISSNPSVLDKNKFGFSDLADYFIQNWNTVQGVKAPNSPADLQKFLLLLFQGNTDPSSKGIIDVSNFAKKTVDLSDQLKKSGLGYMVDGDATKKLNSGVISGNLGDLLSFWVNKDGSDNDAPNEKALRMSNWMNIMSFLIPYPDPTGYAAATQSLASKGVDLKISQSLDLVPDFTDIYLKA